MRIITFSRKNIFQFVLFLTFLGFQLTISAQCPLVANLNQSFCDTQGGINGPTIANLVATSSGNGVKWYATATSSKETRRIPTTNNNY